jgi:ribosome-associated protein
VRRAAGRAARCLVNGPLTFRGITIPASELTWRFSRSSGPGGQSVNTSDSRVELVFDVGRSASVPEPVRERLLSRLAHRLVDGRLTIAASEYRSQHRNREAARTRLVDLLTEASAPPPPKRRPTRPTRGSKERRLSAKSRRSQTKTLRRRPVD